MHQIGQFMERAGLWAVAATLCVWLMIRSIRRSENPPMLILKWILTALIGGFMIWKVGPMTDPSTRGARAFDGFFLSLFCALALTAIWRRNLAALIAKPFGDLFDGGSREIEPHPVYSIAQAKRNRGHYTEAVGEIRKQLGRFPGDFEGQLLLAEIQATYLNDVPGAEVTIRRLCNQSGHSPRNITLALNSLADWHLKFAQDREAARQDLEQILSLLPGSELAALAAQRIAHLAETEFLLEAHDPKRIPLPTHIANAGTATPDHSRMAPETSPEKEAAEYVKHLEAHPLDTEAREKLALLYADHYQRVDLAIDQLEQLITHPAQPAKRVAHWLNLLADVQIRHLADYETVRRTLQRIIDRYPNSAVAEIARNRLNLLKRELKGQQKSQT
jgi:outer membrane protein assembly factor BamD (BamD/ComL family)